MGGVITAVNKSPGHTFSKSNQPEVVLIAGEGVQGDAHCGASVQHRSRVARDAAQPNLRQVHLVHAELLDELVEQGFTVGAGDLGENLTTRGVELLWLPTGTRLRLGAEAVVRVTGLRNPCYQIDQFQHGMLKAVLTYDADSELVRRSGVMAVVLAGGVVRPGDAIAVELPAEPHHALRPV